MTDAPAPMTAERIAKIRADYCMTDEWCLEHPDYAAEVRLWRELFAHIDAQAARIAEMEAAREQAYLDGIVVGKKARDALRVERDDFEHRAKREWQSAQDLAKSFVAAEARALAAEAALRKIIDAPEPVGLWCQDVAIRALAQPKVTP